MIVWAQLTNTWSFSFCQACAVRSEQLKNEIEADFYPECFVIICFFVDFETCCLKNSWHIAARHGPISVTNVKF